MMPTQGRDGITAVIAPAPRHTPVGAPRAARACSHSQLMDGSAMDEARVDRRSGQLDEIAEEALPQRSAVLTRLFATRTSVCVSRTEGGVLRILREGPRRITELAAEERVTQPAITLLVNRLGKRGWVERIPDPTDGRAVLVRLTPAGEQAFERLRAEYRAFLHQEMASLADREVETLATAVGILGKLIDRIQDREP
jgi:DNA-binding MarR family transcriptional regulator